MPEYEKATTASAEKVNPDYYKSLAKADRHIQVLPKKTAQTAMKELTAQNIPFSAVQRAEDVTAVTVHKDHVQALEAACHEVENVQRNSQTHAQEKINPDYFKKLSRNDRHIETLPTGVANRLMADLGAKKIPYSAVRRSDDVCSITVSKSMHAAAMQEALKIAEQEQTEHARKMIHPEVFKQISKEDRFVQRMRQKKPLQSWKNRGLHTLRFWMAINPVLRYIKKTAMYLRKAAAKRYGTMRLPNSNPNRNPNRSVQRKRPRKKRNYHNGVLRKQDLE